MLTQVKVEYPLKQGLKHGGKMFFYEEITNVKVEYPLKQGLKPNLLFISIPPYLLLK